MYIISTMYQESKDNFFPDSILIFPHKSIKFSLKVALLLGDYDEDD